MRRHGRSCLSFRRRRRCSWLLILKSCRGHAAPIAAAAAGYAAAAAGAASLPRTQRRAPAHRRRRTSRNTPRLEIYHDRWSEPPSPLPQLPWRHAAATADSIYGVTTLADCRDAVSPPRPTPGDNPVTPASTAIFTNRNAACLPLPRIPPPPLLATKRVTPPSTLPVLRPPLTTPVAERGLLPPLPHYLRPTPHQRTQHIRWHR